jgi:hypothetical protein
MKRELEVAIGRLVVDGEPRGGARALRASVTRHLESLLAAGEVRAGESGALQIDRLRVDVPAGLGADAAGAHIARGIHDGIAGAKK